MNKKPAPEPVSLASLLHTAATAQAEIEAKLNAVELSFAKLLALRALAEHGESLPLGQLAERLSCVKSNITQLVDRLEADGFVTRAADPHDRRSRLAVLTAAGRKACARGIEIQQASERELLATLTASEARLLGGLLSKLRTKPLR